jgi:hypothetical protein
MVRPSEMRGSQLIGLNLITRNRGRSIGHAYSRQRHTLRWWREAAPRRSIADGVPWDFARQWRDLPERPDGGTKLLRVVILGYVFALSRS